MDANITNRIQDIEERISGAEYKTLTQTVKENAKGKKLLTPNIQEIQETMRKPNLKIICIGDRKIPNLKGQ